MIKKDINRKIKTKKEFILEGHSLSGGIAVARVCLFNETVHREPVTFKINVDDINEEKKRVEKAFSETISRTEKIREEAKKNIGKSEAGIFTAHLMMLKDNSIRRKIDKAIKEKHLNAEAAVREVFDEYGERLAAVDDEYIKEKSSDISEIKGRLLTVLGKTAPTFNCEMQDHCVRGRNRIVIAEELTPHRTMDMDAAKVAGFVTERGGPTSHASILARALGIPAVSGIKGIHSLLDCGMEVVVDGNEGKVIINPSEETVSEIKEKKREEIKQLKKVRPVKEIKVMANISASSDVKEALSMEAEGIGLYRTEFEFIRSGKLLNEEEQYQRYVEVVEKMKNKPVYFRILDLGSDKPAPGLKFIREENPALGLRGARLLEANKNLLKTQARAIARASCVGNVYVMVPMLVDVHQFLNIKKHFQDAVKEVKSGDIKFGAMFEVPSACLEADSILKEADFGSVGSNDLVQYLFAVDRNNDSVSYDYEPDRDAFWNLLKNIVEAACTHGRQISICGEMAAETKYLQKILDSGIKTVSVSPRFIPDVRQSVSDLKSEKKTIENKSEQ